MSMSSASSQSSKPSTLPPHHKPNGGYRNPWPSARPPAWSTLLNKFPFEVHQHPDGKTEATKLKLSDFKKYNATAGDKIVATWLGHAGYLVQLPSTKAGSTDPPYRMLFDPIFSARAGPSQWTGPKRLLDAPCTVKDLPRVDICCISHSHYDHLDLNTITELKKYQPHIRYFVPLGLKAWFIATVSEELVTEMDWWDSTDSQTAERADGSKGFFKIVCTPAQHKSGRTALDQDMTLWCGWAIEQYDSLESKQRTCSVYFAGDTGYRNSQDPNIVCPIFKEIGERYGPFDFSMIPIWRGGSLSFISWAGLRLTHDHILLAHHASPEDAVRLHLDVKSRHTIGIHHSCFVGSELEGVEPLFQLSEAKKDRGVGDWEDEGGFGCVDVGVTVEIGVEAS